MTVTPFPSGEPSRSSSPVSGEEFEFTIGFQTLKGLSTDGVYGIAWRKGTDSGRTPTVTSNNGEVEISTEVTVSEMKTKKEKQLFEVYVNRYQGQVKETVGMLFMDLSMHVPKNGKLTSKQSAYLQLSNCLCESTRLSLTVRCVQKESPASQQEIVPKPLPNQNEAQLVKELRDEIAYLSIQNQRLKKNEESYTYTNQPVRQNTKALESEILSLKQKLANSEQLKQDDLEIENRKMELAADELREMVKRLKVQHIQEISDYKIQLDAANKRALENSNVASTQHQTAVQQSQQVAATQSRELSAMQHQLSLSQQQIDVLRQKLVDKDQFDSRLQMVLDEKIADCAALTATNEANEGQKVCLTRRIAQLEREYRELFAQTSDEKNATEDAKNMLNELMDKVKHSQVVEETLQSALSITEEEKRSLMQQVTDLNNVIQKQQQDLSTIRLEENAVCHNVEASLRTELETERVSKQQLTSMITSTEAQLSRTKSEKHAIEVKAKVQEAKLVQRKRRITDLKRILGLHLKLKQAQMGPADLSDLPLVMP